MAEWVTNEPSGPGEYFIMQDNAMFFRDWKNVVVNINPVHAWNVISHMEASGATRVGDAPVVEGLARAGISPGEAFQADIYSRMHQAGATEGVGWDAFGIRSLVTEPEGNLPEGWHYEQVGSQRVPVKDNSTDMMPNQGPAIVPEDEGTDVFSVIKGTSRWLFDAINAIPIFGGDWRNSFGRAVSYVKEGTLTPQQALAGLTGGGLPVAGLASVLAWGLSEEEITEAQEMVGLPFYQYLRDLSQGERLEMGTGWFSQGEIAPDIANVMAEYDDETHGPVIKDSTRHGLLGLWGEDEERAGGLNEADFIRMRNQMGGKLTVQGMGGVEYEAKSLEEWKDLRDNVGRAALLSDLTAGSNQQRAMGIPYGSFQKPIYSNQVMLRQYGSGNYFSTSVGRNFASIFSDPETQGFRNISGGADLFNQVMDFGAATKGAHLISGNNKYLGLGGESGELRQGTATLVRMVEGADSGSRAAVIRDAASGRLNMDLAANALARYNDLPLRDARNTLNSLRQAAQDKAYREGSTAWNVDLLATRAAKGNQASARLLTQLAEEGGLANHTDQVVNLLGVQGRVGTDLVNGVWGKAEVGDDVLATATAQARHLQDLVSEGRASVVFDPENSKQMLTFDADIGRAQQTLTRVNDEVVNVNTARQAAAKRYKEATLAYEEELAAATAYWGPEIRAYHGTRTAGPAIVQSGKLIPGPSQQSGRGVYLSPDKDFADKFAVTYNPKTGTYEKLGDVFAVEVRLGRSLDRTSKAGEQVFQDSRRLARSQNRDVSEVLLEQGYDSVRGKLQGGQGGQEQIIMLRDVPLKTPPIQTPRLAMLYDEVIEAAKNPELAGVVDEAGLTLDGTKLTKWANMDVAEESARTQARLLSGLLTENYTATRRAARLLGDKPETAEEIANAQRVMKRANGDTLLSEFGPQVPPKLKPGQINKLFVGGGRLRQWAEEVAAAKNHDEMNAILRTTVNEQGTVPPALIDALVDANNVDEVAAVMMRDGAGQFIMSPRMALLGKTARFGTLSTAAGIGGGGIAGAYSAFEEGGDTGEILGGAIGGAVAGALIGSGLAGATALGTGSKTRSIESVADAMDLLLAGTRSATADMLRSNNVEVGKALQGLSVPSQLNYAYAHSPLGRRLGRGFEVEVDLNNPTKFYYGLADYTRSLGLRLNDEIEIWGTGVGKEGADKKIVTSRLSPDEITEARAQLVADGYHQVEVVKMDDVFKAASQMLSNNPARGHDLLIKWAQVADAYLSKAGMDEARIKMLTDTFRDGAQEFMGALDAMGTPAARMQEFVMNGVQDISQGARLDTEMWSGTLHLPAPERVFRAVNQLDTVGRTVQLFTGKGVLDQFKANMARVGKGEQWQHLTPELERNVGMQIARFITSGLWSTAVLLGRPFSFVSKVLGEDQARMTFSNIPNIITHPMNYLSAIAANFKTFRNMKIRPFGIGPQFGPRYGIAARSDLGDISWIDKNGNVIEDELDKMGIWKIAEDARNHLNIFSKETATQRRRSVFGSRAWTTIGRHEPGPGYVEAMATVFTQKIGSPIAQHMARSTADDVVADTARWLRETTDGQAVARRWAGQFPTREEAEHAMAEGNLEAFLHDQYAALHLHTGGDWVFSYGNNMVMNSTGTPLHMEELAARGLLDLEPGYVITKHGDPELLDVVQKGSLQISEDVVDDLGKPQYSDEGLMLQVERDIELHKMDEAKYGIIRDLIRRKHNQYEQAAGTKNYDPHSAHRFPLNVKGQRLSDEGQEIGGRGIATAYDDAVDRWFSWWMGTPSRVASRQPTMGGFFWERIGMLIPSMTDEMATAFRRLADEEGALARVNEVAADISAFGPSAKGTLNNVRDIDLNAKAYAIERTRQTLFDLHRQRNFIDGMRVAIPFAGPFLEAMEAWARVVKRNPYRVWRRGTQLVDSAWNTTGLGDDTDPLGMGWFYTNPENGEEMFHYPLGGSGMFPELASDLSGGNVEMSDIGARARGLNVVFGPDDLTQGEGIEVAGFPLEAFNPGISPIGALAAPLFWQNRTGSERKVFDFFFPYGEPENLGAAMLPYNLRKLFEGIQGAVGNSSPALTRNTMDQYARMMANGEIGQGPEYDFNLLDRGGQDAAMEEAQNRAVGAFLVESLARTVLPTMVTPEVKVEVEANPELADIVGIERIQNTDALGNFAYDLMQPGTAQWWETDDGYMVSTEGDWEITTAYMNELFGKDMYSAEFLSLPLIDKVHVRPLTGEGLDWMRGHEPVMDEWPSSATLLMPDYANVKASERPTETGDSEYSFEAADYAKDRGDMKVYTFDEQKAQVNSRLLRLREDEIEREADQIFGFDEDLEDNEEAQMAKEAYIIENKEDAKGLFPGGDVPEGNKLKVFEELVSWDGYDWEAQNLTPEETATVDAVLWYLSFRDVALDLARAKGVNSLDDKGSEDVQPFMQGLRHDLRVTVARQLELARQTGTDMGNFRYIWKNYLESEIMEPEEEYDPLTILAKYRAGEAGMESLAMYLPTDTRVSEGPFGWGSGANVGVEVRTGG